MIPKSWNRFPAFAKPASAGEARSDKIHAQTKEPIRFIAIQHLGASVAQSTAT
jgi:hypothetical protein